MSTRGTRWRRRNAKRPDKQLTFPPSSRGVLAKRKDLEVVITLVGLSRLSTHVSSKSVTDYEGDSLCNQSAYSPWKILLAPKQQSFTNAVVWLLLKVETRAKTWILNVRMSNVERTPSGTQCVYCTRSWNLLAFPINHHTFLYIHREEVRTCLCRRRN